MMWSHHHPWQWKLILKAHNSYFWNWWACLHRVQHKIFVELNVVSLQVLDCGGGYEGVPQIAAQEQECGKHSKLKIIKLILHWNFHVILQISPNVLKLNQNKIFICSFSLFYFHYFRAFLKEKLKNVNKFNSMIFIIN